ncbi:MAG: hypothetical protein KC731_17100 [Myxococcales bacterium]|nr:hypothetical protein [Myxococcales bacterium]
MRGQKPRPESLAIVTALVLLGACGGDDDSGTGGGGAAPDPCASHDCDPRATCEALADGYACSCRDGYEGDGKTCSNVDECALGSDDCAADATCFDDDGSFHCVCDAGFVGDGVSCDDVDECQAGVAGCAEHATCENLPGSYSCSCEPGYLGDGVTCLLPGDTCVDAIEVPSLPFAASGTLVGFEDHYAASGCPGAGLGEEGAGHADVSYAFTPSEAGRYRIQLVRPNNDAPNLIYVTTDCDDQPGACLAESGDLTLAGLRPFLDLDLEAGVTYYVVLDGFCCNDVPSSYDLEIRALESYESFFVGNGAPPTSQQCDDFTAWRNGLGSGYTAMHFYGNGDPVGILCEDPAIVDQFAQALATGTSVNLACNGYHWSYCDSLSQEIWVSTTNGLVCNQSNCPDPGHILRPCLPSSSWGGFGTATCGLIPDQLLGFDFY